MFAITKGKLFGHIISKEGITIDPKHVKVIALLYFSHKKKVIQSFFGNINFFKRFIPNFIKTIKPLQKLIKKYVEFKWTKDGKKKL
jgi:hypothetical protein